MIPSRFISACILCLAGLAGISEAADPAVSSDVVLHWNRTLLSIVRTPGAQPATIHPTRSFAMMHAAIYDAVNAIDRGHRPYAVRLSGVSRRASQPAAGAVAAHDVLVALYPSLAPALDADLHQSLTLVPDGEEKREGLRVGAAAAAAVLQLRSADGALAPPVPYVFGTAPGDYQSTPPNFPKQPVFTHWSRVTPFALRRASQFRPGPPPALMSDRYGDAVEEVASMGIAGSTSATADEALTGRFWNGQIQNYWNEIAQAAAEKRRLTIAQSARLFALLNLSLADSVIAFYDAKYTYNRWRPVTAIRGAATDDNPDTIADPNWLPEVGNTAPDPAYPGAHAVISAAAEEVLVSVLERNHLEFDVTSEVLPNVTRSFDRFSAAAEEASLSRIFAGVHFRFDLTSGHRLGRDVADFVVDRFLTTRRPDDGDDDDSR
jgi:hypothetical protein